MAKVSLFARPGTTPLASSSSPTPTKSANPAPATAPVITQPPAPAPAPAVQPAPAVPPTPPTPAPAVTPAVAPQVDATPPADEGTAEYTNPPPPAFYDGDDGGAFNPGDLVLPRLNIVQKVGDLSNVHPPGSIVLNGQLVLAVAPVNMAVGNPVRIVVIGMQPTTFAEKRDGGERGNYFRTEADVVANGGTLDWGESQATDKPLYQRVSIALVAVEKPDGIDGAMFPHTFGGKQYALALYTMKGTAYTNAARYIKSARKIGHLSEHTLGIKVGNLRHGTWLFAAQLKKYGSNFAYIPVIKPAENTSEAFRKELTELLGM